MVGVLLQRHRRWVWANGFDSLTEMAIRGGWVRDLGLGDGYGGDGGGGGGGGVGGGGVREKRDEGLV